MNDGTFFIYFIYFVILFFVAPFVMKRAYKKIETIIRMKIKKLRDADGDIYFSAESRQFPGVVGGGRTKKRSRTRPERQLKCVYRIFEREEKSR